MLISNFQMFSWKKWKGNWNEKPKEPQKPILKNFSQNWVDFDHFGNKYQNKGFFEIIQTCDLKTLLVRQ